MVNPSTLLIIPKISKCNANCTFCITRNTPESEKIREDEVSIKKLKAVCKFALNAGTVDSDITGGTEPTLIDAEKLCEIASVLHEHFGRVCMHTNGARLLSKTSNGTLITDLAAAGLTNLTISRAHHDDAENQKIMGIQYNLEETVSAAIGAGIDVKLSCILLKKGVSTESDVSAYISKAKSIGVNKVLFKELREVDTAFKAWSDENRVDASVVKDLMKKMNAVKYKGVWNQTIWHCNEMSITAWPDGSRKDTINDGDLIFMPDNRLYSSFNCISSRVM